MKECLRLIEELIADLEWRSRYHTDAGKYCEALKLLFSEYKKIAGKEKK